MVQIRTLEPDEYQKLADHPLLEKVGLPNPDTSRIIVALDGDDIVAFWVLLMTAHTEPVWIRPDYRGGTVAGRMWKKMTELLDEFQIKAALSCCNTAEVAGYLERLGFSKSSMSIYVYSKDEKVKCLLL